MVVKHARHEDGSRESVTVAGRMSDEVRLDRAEAASDALDLHAGSHQVWAVDAPALVAHRHVSLALVTRSAHSKPDG